MPGTGRGHVVPSASELVGASAGYAQDGFDAPGLEFSDDVVNLGDGADAEIGRCLGTDFLDITFIEQGIPHDGLLYVKSC